MASRSGLGPAARLRAAVWQVASSPVGRAWLTRDVFALLRAEGPVAPLAAVWAVRRDWPDGTHELCCPRRGLRRARRDLVRDVRYWRRGPLRPRHELVVLTLAEFRAHRADGWCRSRACPVKASATAMAAGVAW